MPPTSLKEVSTIRANCDLLDAISDKKTNAVLYFLEREKFSEQGLDDALWLSETMGQTEIGAAIMKKGGDQYTQLDGKLNYAASIGDIQQMTALEDDGADIENTDSTPLKLAIENHHLNAAKLAHRKGAKLLDALDKPTIQALKQKTPEEQKIEEWIKEQYAKGQNTNSQIHTSQPNFKLTRMTERQDIRSPVPGGMKRP